MFLSDAYKKMKKARQMKHMKNMDHYPTGRPLTYKDPMSVWYRDPSAGPAPPVDTFDWARKPGYLLANQPDPESVVLSLQWPDKFSYIDA